MPQPRPVRSSITMSDTGSSRDDNPRDNDRSTATSGGGGSSSQKVNEISPEMATYMRQLLSPDPTARSGGSAVLAPPGAMPTADPADFGTDAGQGAVLTVSRQPKLAVSKLETEKARNATHSKMVVPEDGIVCKSAPRRRALLFCI